MVSAACLSLLASPPNIVLILADDQGWNALSTPMDPDIPESGSRYFRTSNLDQLASEGMRFSRAYSGGATCSPSRHSIQFGRTPSSLGIKQWKGLKSIHADYADSLVNVLKRVHPEYTAAHFGKWHMLPSPAELGYDFSDGMTHNKDGDSSDPLDPKRIDSLTGKAENFMEQQVENGKPFFLQLSHYADHLTFQARRETLEKYRTTYAADKTRYHNDPLWAAMNENMDDSVGRIMAKLKELGIERNTIVIYTADNGYENKTDGKKLPDERGFYKAYPQRGHKYILNEGGIRVPLIMKGPGIQPNTVCRAPVAGLDLLPTLLHMVGNPEQIPESIEGGSLVPVFNGADHVERKVPGLVFRFTKWQKDLAIVQGKYKLLKNLESQQMYLWDLSEDIGEQNNLIQVYPEMAKKMDATLTAYLNRVGMGGARAKNTPTNTSRN